MGSLSPVLLSLQGVTNRVVTALATDSAFILRSVPTTNGKGGTTKNFNRTTVGAHPCFHSLVPDNSGEREDVRATERRPTMRHRFVFRSDVDVLAADRVQLVATRGVAEKELKIVGQPKTVGLTIEVIAIEEAPTE